MSKVIQTGLYTTKEEELEAFADRVSDFNKSKGFIVVEMEGRESDADELVNKPHWKITLQFASHAYAREFWTDDKYDVLVLVPDNDTV